MELPEERTESEAVKGNVTVWRPWQLKQLELFQAVAISLPSCQHLLQEYGIVSVQSGAASYRYRNAHDQIANEGCYVMEPGEAVSCQTKDFTYYSLCIDPVWLQQFATRMLHWEKGLPHFPRHPLCDPALSRAVRDLAASSQVPVSLLRQEETLLHLLSPLLLFHTQYKKALPQLGWEQPAITRTKEYLEVHYAEEVALQDLATEANLSPFHLAHVFRQVVGLPPHAYQTQLRLAHARALLMQGYDAGWVAHETGFSDQSHFTRLFKRYVLMTPGSYRKTARWF